MPFLSKSDEERVVKAISDAENNTSGEIRLHIEKLCIGQDALQRAIKLFHKLEMTATEQRNGVLIYISTVDHKLAIYGDVGINEKVGKGFWEEEIQILKEHFKKNKNAEGLEKAILKVGEKLKEFFPFKDDDTNELSNEISYG